MWEYKVGINAIIANFVCIWRSEEVDLGNMLLTPPSTFPSNQINQIELSQFGKEFRDTIL